MVKIGDRVQVARSHVGNDLEWATVISILPAIGDRVAMYRIRLEKEITVPTLTPNPNECWVDEGMVYGPFIDQNIGWDN